MVKISEKNNSKFKLLILENLTDSKLKKYSKFVKENNISMINCRAPQGEGYYVNLGYIFTLYINKSNLT